MVMVLINGLIIDNIMVNGSTIRCMEWESSLGQTVESMMASILTTKSKDMVYSPGLIIDNTMVTG